MLTPEEKKILNEACNVYVQVVAQQLPPEQVNGLVTIIGQIFQKIDNGSIDKTIDKPEGITDEWFENVCESCEQLNGTMCKDKVTEKFPGKCDPILTYERQKIIDNKNSKESTNIIGDSSAFMNKVMKQ